MQTRMLFAPTPEPLLDQEAEKNLLPLSEAHSDNSSSTSFSSLPTFSALKTLPPANPGMPDKNQIRSATSLHE